MPPRFDFVFSYWIFFWFLLFASGWTKYNPFVALSIALAENILGIPFLLYFKFPLLDIGLFAVVNFFIKVVPLIWLLHHKAAIFHWKDVKFTAILFCIYIAWLLINGVRPDFHQKKLDTPMIHIIKKLCLKA